MLPDAIGPEEIRAALGEAIEAANERAEEVGGVGGVLTEAADRFESLEMAASTVGHIRDAAEQFTAAEAALSSAAEELEAALADFNARDGQVADTVADTGNLASVEILTEGGTSAAAGGYPRAPANDPTTSLAGQAALRGELRELRDGPPGQAPDGIAAPVPLDQVPQYRVARDGSLHHYPDCRGGGGCVGCYPMDDVTAYDRGRREGAHGAPVDTTLADHARYGQSYRDGLRAGRAAALTNAGWTEQADRLTGRGAGVAVDTGAMWLGDPDAEGTPYLDWSTHRTAGGRGVEVGDGTAAVGIDLTAEQMRTLRDQLGRTLGPDGTPDDTAMYDLDDDGAYIDWSIHTPDGGRSVEVGDGTDAVVVQLTEGQLRALHTQLAADVHDDDTAALDAGAGVIRIHRADDHAQVAEVADRLHGEALRRAAQVLDVPASRYDDDDRIRAALVDHVSAQIEAETTPRARAAGRRERLAATLDRAAITAPIRIDPAEWGEAVRDAALTAGATQADADAAAAQVRASIDGADTHGIPQEWAR